MSLGGGGRDQYAPSVSDDGQAGDSASWGYEPEYDPPAGGWWNQPGALIALVTGTVGVVVGIIALVVFTGPDAQGQRPRSSQLGAGGLSDA